MPTMPTRPSGDSSACVVIHRAASSMTSVLAGVIWNRRRSGGATVTTA
jgi:hypothetical protein